MTRTKSVLRALGIFSTGSLVTYAATHREFFEKKVTLAADDTVTAVTKNQNNKLLLSRDLDSVIERCRTKLEQWKIKQCIPGAVIAVSVQGKTVWKYGMGLADIENNVPCNETTVMRIGSISKSIAAAYLMRMVQQEKLDLDSPIRSYLTVEEFPDKHWEGKNVDITLRQLAAHLGGIRHYKKDNNKELPEFLSNKNYPTAIEGLEIFKNDPLVSKPGTKFVYTTFGWSLISAVIESRLDKKNFGNGFQKFIRTELGLKFTQLDENSPIIPNRSKFYYFKDSKLLNCPGVDNSCKWAGGGLVANITDLLQFGNLMLYSYLPQSSGVPGFFTQAQVREMWNPCPGTIQDGSFSGYGIGWVTVQDGRRKVAFGPEAPFETYALHTGAAVGASTVLFVEPKNEIVVAVITNLQGVGGVYEMAVKIAQEFSNSAH